jgi:hypothetical protein
MSISSTSDARSESKAILRKVDLKLDSNLNSDSQAIMSYRPSEKITQCNTCNKIFKNNQGLTYHVTHSVCLKYICLYCGRRFKSLLGKKYHTENKICLPQEKIKVSVTAKNNFHPYTISRDKIKLVDVMKHTPGNFGDELFESSNIILKFVELSLANPRLDQYWSCYISNRREPYVTVYDGDVWKLQPQLLEYDEISKWALEKIFNYLEDNKTSSKRSYWTKYYIIKEQLDRKNPGVVRHIKQGLFCLFVNQKAALTEKMTVTGIEIKP